MYGYDGVRSVGCKEDDPGQEDCGDENSLVRFTSPGRTNYRESDSAFEMQS